VQIEASFLKYIKDMVHDFELTDYMSLTTHIWSANNKNYLGMTAHLLNEDLKRKSYVLACCRFKGSHTYDRIAEQLNGVFARYKIAVDKKEQGILTDNTSNFS